MNILLYRDLSPDQLAALTREFPRVTFRQTTKAAEVEASLDWPEVIFGNVPAALAARASNLKWLQIVSSGIDDYVSLAGKRVVVTTAHGLHAAIIAQHTLMMILLFERGQRFFDQAQRDKKWERKPAVPRRLEGRTLALLGFGAIGQELARLVAPLGLRVIAAKRTAAADNDGSVEIFPWDRVDELLAQADHLVLALPLTAETRNVLDAKRLARLKSDAVVHNVGRGGLLDEAALLERLRAGLLGGAALDTFETEPLPPDSPWWTAPNTIVTPHIAGHHRDLGPLTLDRFLENLRLYLAGQPLRPIANFARGY